MIFSLPKARARSAAARAAPGSAPGPAPGGASCSAFDPMPTDAVADPVSAWARSTLDNLLDEIFVVDSDSRVVYANRAACKNLGYTQEETCELSVADFDAHMTLSLIHI